MGKIAIWIAAIYACGFAIAWVGVAALAVGQGEHEWTAAAFNAAWRWPWELLKFVF